MTTHLFPPVEDRIAHPHGLHYFGFGPDLLGQSGCQLAGCVCLRLRDLGQHLIGDHENDKHRRTAHSKYPRYGWNMKLPPQKIRCQIQVENRYQGRLFETAVHRLQPGKAGLRCQIGNDRRFPDHGVEHTSVEVGLKPRANRRMMRPRT